ncbi:MAG: hypothetical protein CMO81_09410 [Waddliaceae bacterium]|nr:hypothetical protein [Waddliaceae bacterium]
MHCAIIGAGFSGLATAWYLLNQGIQVTLFEQTGLGSGASGHSAGLLHPFVGFQARLNPFGREGMEETKKLLHIANLHTDEEVFSSSGILRIPCNPKQAKHFKECAEIYEDVHYCNEEKIQEIAPGLQAREGVLIQSGIAVNPNAYLKGLFQASLERGLLYKKKKIESFADLEEFDGKVFCAGSGTKTIHGLEEQPIYINKGQIIELVKPEVFTPPSVPVIGSGYLCSQGKRLMLGSTYERNYSCKEANIEEAEKLLRPKAEQFYRKLGSAELRSVFAGLRASTGDQRLPIAEEIKKNTYLLSGFGSKGLLWHAVFAKNLSIKISQNDH